MAKKKKRKNWIQDAIRKPGALSAAFPGMAKGGFSNEELNSIIKSPRTSTTNKRRAILAKTLKGFPKKGSKKRKHVHGSGAFSNAELMAGYKKIG